MNYARLSTHTLLFLLLLPASYGCSTLVNSLSADSEKLKQIEKDKLELRASGGEELVQDYESWVRIAQPATTLAYQRPSGVNDTKECLFNYSDILARLKDDSSVSSTTWAQSRSSCIASSNANESQELVAISQKYTEKIEQLRKDYDQGDASEVLSQLHAQAEAAGAPLVLYWSLDYADEQIAEAAEKLGQEHALISEYTAKFAQLREQRAEDMQKANDFFAREDIKTVKQEIQTQITEYNTHSKKHTAYVSAYRDACEANAAADGCAALQAKIIDEDSAKQSVKTKLDEARAQRDKLAIEAGVLSPEGWPDFDLYFD